MVKLFMGLVNTMFYSKFIETLGPYTFFNTEIFYFIRVPKNKGVNEFIKHSFPKRVDKFKFSIWGKCKTTTLYYFDQIIRVGPKVLKQVNFSNFILNIPKLKRLSVAYKHVEILCLDNNMLYLPYPPYLNCCLKNSRIEDFTLSCMWVDDGID
ncbi:unnamed protein product [Moneuplotes crassus]|uniref:Uncharacterized protein n=1 Tax=Euplotes crassus TaxID=5936 RepID=A0AAD1UR73_EUPCR|nr:unnamed protein product [Moneuplotes crassus]